MFIPASRFDSLAVTWSHVYNTKEKILVHPLSLDVWDNTLFSKLFDVPLDEVDHLWAQMERLQKLDLTVEEQALVNGLVIMLTGICLSKVLHIAHVLLV